MIFNLTATDMTKVESMLANAGGGQKMCIPSETVRYSFDAEEIIPKESWGESASITEVSCNLFYIQTAGDICVKLYDMYVSTGNEIIVGLKSGDETGYSNIIQESSMPTMSERTPIPTYALSSGYISSATKEHFIGSHDVVYVILNVPSAGIYGISMSDKKYISVKKVEICYDFSDTFSFAKYEK